MSEYITLQTDILKLMHTQYVLEHSDKEQTWSCFSPKGNDR